jgi:hypothetical protein
MALFDETDAKLKICNDIYADSTGFKLRPLTSCYKHSPLATTAWHPGFHEGKDHGFEDAGAVCHADLPQRPRQSREQGPTLAMECFFKTTSSGVEHVKKNADIAMKTCEEVLEFTSSSIYGTGAGIGWSGIQEDVTSTMKNQSGLGPSSASSSAALAQDKTPKCPKQRVLFWECFETPNLEQEVLFQTPFCPEFHAEVSKQGVLFRWFGFPMF